MDNFAAPAAPAGDSRARRMMLAAQKLAEPSFSLFNLLFINGETPESVQRNLKMTPEEFSRKRTNMLRSLMTASQ